MTRFALALPAALLAAGPAAAHIAPVAHGSFAAGFAHPLLGADHLLAMVAVGLWAGTLGGQAMWALPSAFVAAMGAGFVLALAGASLPMVEPMILGSVLLLGALAAMATRLPLRLAAAGVALTGIAHGHAHGAEMGGASPLLFLAGFAAATAALHAGGVFAGRGVWTWLARGLGVAVATAGAALILVG